MLSDYFMKEMSSQKNMSITHSNNTTQIFVEQVEMHKRLLHKVSCLLKYQPKSNYHEPNILLEYGIFTSFQTSL